MNDEALERILAELRARGFDVQGVMTLEEARRHLAQVLADEGGGESLKRRVSGKCPQSSQH